MKVGILGSGIVGRTLGAGFIQHGHAVMVGTRDTDKAELRQWAEKTPGAKTGSFADAAQYGEMIVLAATGRAYESVIRQAGPVNFGGKVLLDVTNPLADSPPVNGVLIYTTGPNESLGEKVQALVPAARVVKSFNSVGSMFFVNPKFVEGVPTMFLCGNDEDAKRQVAEVIRQFGWDPYDCGTITSARALEPLCILWCAPGMLRNDWTHAFKMLRH